MEMGKKLELVNMVRERKQHSESAFQGYYKNVAKWYDYYRGDLRWATC